MKTEIELVNLFDDLVSDHDLSDDEKKELQAYLDKTLSTVQKFKETINDVCLDENNLKDFYESLTGEKLENINVK